MIYHPREGQRVQAWYAKAKAPHMPHHGKLGTVEIVSRGPGPRNVMVRFDDGTSANVPRGNIRIPA